MVSTEVGSESIRAEPRTTGAAPGSDRGWAWLAGAAVLLAAALAAVELGGPALEYDEAYTVGVVRGPFGETWRRVTSFDMVQAPYYLLMSAWYEVGEREAVLRLPSVAFFVASVPLLFGLGRRLLDARVGAIAAVLVALNPLALKWAQTARAYAMALFLVTLLAYVLVWALERPGSTRRAVVYGVLAVGAVYAQFLVGLVVAAQFLSLLARRPQPWRFAAVAGAVVAAGTVPAAVWVLTLRSDPLEWLDPPGLRSLLSMLAMVTGGGALQFFVLGPLAVVGAAMAWWSWRGVAGSSARWPAALLALWLVVPVATLVASTYTVKPLLHSRYLLLAVPAFALLVASAVVGLFDRHRVAGAAVAAVVLPVAALGAASHFRSNDEHEWRTATAAIQAQAEPGDAIVVVPANARSAVEYYLRRLDGPELGTLQPQLDDEPTPDGLWVVDWSGGSRDPRSWNPMPDFPRWLDAHYRLVDRQPVSETTTLLRYERRS